MHDSRSLALLGFIVVCGGLIKITAVVFSHTTIRGSGEYCIRTVANVLNYPSFVDYHILIRQLDANRSILLGGEMMETSFFSSLRHYNLFKTCMLTMLSKIQPRVVTVQTAAPGGFNGTLAFLDRCHAVGVKVQCTLAVPY